MAALFQTSQNQIYHKALWFSTIFCVKCLNDDKINSYNDLQNIEIIKMVMKSIALLVGI